MKWVVAGGLVCSWRCLTPSPPAAGAASRGRRRSGVLPFGMGYSAVRGCSIAVDGSASHGFSTDFVPDMLTART